MFTKWKVMSFFRYAVDYFTFRKRLARLLNTDVGEVWKAYDSLLRSGFYHCIQERAGCAGNFFDLGMLNFMRAPTMYVVCKLLNPIVVVETGVANGFSSSFILYALEENKRGTLYSIDLPNQPGEEISKQVGWLVPEELRGRWELIIGDTSIELPKVTSGLGGIDIFFHDSDHSYEHVLMELDTVWWNLRDCGIVLVDDVRMSSAFDHFFSDKVSRLGKLWKLGIAIKV